jgi:hypothetical protein
MFPKKTSFPLSRPWLQKRNWNTCARKSALDSLIQSLEDYDRFRSVRMDRKRKLA